jgi:hypothetical protein
LIVESTSSLAAYLLRATESNLVMMLASSDPNTQSVAPFGGTRAVFTPNPIALGVPTSSTPLLIDISASLTTNGMSARRHASGQLFDEPWMLDAHGDATRDPGVLFADPPGTILPLGGLSAGHKGFDLALLIESAHRWPGGIGPRGSRAGLGRNSLHDALRSGGICRPRSVATANGLARRCVPQQSAARPGRSRALAGRARDGAACRAARAWRAASSHHRRATASMRRAVRRAVPGDVRRMSAVVSSVSDGRHEKWIDEEGPAPLVARQIKPHSHRRC